MVNKAEDFVPKVKEIVGDEYPVEVGNLSGSVKVMKDSKVIFRIFYSVTYGRGGFVVRLDDPKHASLGKKVAKDLGIGFVD